jgi:hypothetical protein
VVSRYLAAGEANDFDRLASLLRSDAVLSVPPLPLRYVGREAIIGFYAMLRAAAARPMDRLVPTRANRQPALAA